MNRETKLSPGQTAADVAASSAARWEPGLMDRIKSAEGAALFSCMLCGNDKTNLGVLFGKRKVCTDCCLETVRERLVAGGQLSAAAHVDVPRSEGLRENQKFDASRPASPDNPAMVMAQVPEHVRRWERVSVRCTGKNCPDPVFTASFDEIHRSVVCPSCGRETPTPQHTWGNP